MKIDLFFRKPHYTSESKCGLIIRTQKECDISEKLFPEYLNAGSRGPAVVVLQILLLGGSNNLAIIPDGIYGEQTVIGVMDMQKSDLGMEDEDVDGNFGPKTRAELKRQYNIDVDALLADMFVGETVAIGS